MAAPVQVSILDVSEGGCFIYTMSDDLAEEDNLHLSIQELEDKSPILVNVRWRTRWGRPNALPGLGVMFVSIKKDQLAELINNYIKPRTISFLEESKT